METGDIPTSPHPLFQELGIEKPITLDVLRLGGKRFHRGIEGMHKYVDVDISRLGLGVERGFVHFDSGDGSDVKSRYQKWQHLRSDGFSDHTFQLCVPVLAQDERGVEQPGLLTEDLVTDDSDIIDLISYRTGERTQIIDEAAKWLEQFMAKLHEGTLQENIDRIPQPALRTALQRQRQEHLAKQHDTSKMPGWDPFIEAEAAALLSRLEIKGWGATSSAFFLQISRTHQDWWPYRRKLVIGDLGAGIEKKPSSRVERGKVYDLIQYSYYTGSH